MKLLSVMITSFFLILLIPSHSLFNPQSNPHHRLLTISEENYNKICVSYNKTDILNNNSFFNYNNSLNDYFKDLSFIKTDLSEEIKVAVLTEDSDERSSAIRKIIQKTLLPFIIFLIFAVVSVILWIVLCGCICCPRCCCNNSNSDSKVCSKFLLFVMIVFLIGIGVVCIIGFVVGSRTDKNINLSSCSLFRTYLDLSNGENKTETPKWIGVYSLDEKISKLRSINEEISLKKEAAFKKNTTNSTEEYTNLLVSSYNSLKSRRVSNPNPDKFNDKTYIPSYIVNYGSLLNNISSITLLSKEFNLTFQYTNYLIDRIKENFDVFIGEINKTNSALNSSQSQINQIKSQFKEIDYNYTEKYYNFTEETSKGLNYSFIGIFVVLFVLDLLLLVFLIVFTCCDKTCFKYLSHIVWNLLMIITIPFFIVTSALGVIGTVFIYMGPLLNTLFSEEGLKKIIKNDTQSVNIINKCINGNGQLESVLFSDSNYLINAINRFYNYSIQLEENKPKINITSNLTKTYKESYTNMIDDVGFDLFYNGNDLNTDSPLSVLKSFSQFTDASASDSYQSSCNKRVYDFWNTQRNPCPVLYKNVSSSNPIDNIGFSSCMKIREWKQDSISARYVSRPECTSGTEFLTKALAYSRSLNAYGDESEPVLKELITEMNKFEVEFNKTGNDITEAYSSVQSITKPMITFFNNEIGGRDFFSLLNCNFLSRNMVYIVIVFKDLGYNFVSISACLAAALLINWIIMSISVIVISRYNTMLKEGNNQQKLTTQGGQVDHNKIELVMKDK